MLDELHVFFVLQSLPQEFDVKLLTKKVFHSPFNILYIPFF